MNDAANRKIETALTHTLTVIKKPAAYERIKKPARLGRDPIKNKRYLSQFKDWIIPEQPTGYIKARKNEIL